MYQQMNFQLWTLIGKPSTVYVFIQISSWYTITSLNERAWYYITRPSTAWVVTVVIDSGIENTYDVSYFEPTHTNPACSKCHEYTTNQTLNEISAWAAVLDFGTSNISSKRYTVFLMLQSLKMTHSQSYLN